MAEFASDREAAAGRPVGQLGSARFDGAGLEGGPVDAAPPHVHRLVGPRPADRCDAKGRGKDGVDGRVDEGEVLPGDELDDLGLCRNAAIESDGERSERGDVLGGDHADVAAADGDDRTRADAVVQRAVRDHDDRSVVRAARRLGGCGGELQREQRSQKARRVKRGG